MESFNETSFLVSTYLFLLFSGFNYNIVLKVYSGWAFVIVCLFTISVNYVVVIV